MSYNSVPQVSKSTVKVLSNISNNTCFQHNDHLCQTPFNCSGSFGNHCPIKLQEQDMISVNTNTNSEENAEDILLLSDYTRNSDCSGNTSGCYVYSSVMSENRCEKSEVPINVQVVRRNWTVSEYTQNDVISSRNDTKFMTKSDITFGNQETPLYNNNNFPKLILSRNSAETQSTWKSHPQLQYGQVGCNQLYQGNPSSITLQKNKHLSNPCHQKSNGDLHEKGKIIRIHSFQFDTGSRRASALPYSVKYYSPVSGGDLLTNKKSEKGCNENIANQNKVNETVQSCNVNSVIDHNKKILKMLPFFTVVHKKLKWSCSYCGEPLATRLSLTTHIKSHLLPWCRICLKIVNSNEQLFSHMEKKHPSSDTEVDEPEMQLVTSKYGRKRRVYSPATLLTKRRIDIKK